ncbi:spinster family MFS transporter [Simiduia agarivorans]|uniref:Major facilitator superfamily transporter n=1 Tax=Simiduia agarivorans (strain DSM 21679 / JCM 13881 / BCRC 17597 / SA1) TaxID=1117647 RepID=K4KMY1_SIMAS|nr:MFS transporter [Simiduia agarivorans]AFV00382.1 major facilitator superfamily transporter [Simiduia agarivorans SA1 = DSM 21679]
MNSAQPPVQMDVPTATSSGRRYYILALLTFAYVFNFVDRQIIAILQDPIKAEFSLSDTQLGLLNGFAFALFYVGFGLPLARWADAGNRRNLLAWAVALWSLMTALCGLAQNYVQLLLARMGVGVGEAGCSPAAHSMISDLFPVEQRATALGVYSVGVNVGILAGFIAGGWLNEVYGWRVALMAVGLPGLLLALWIRISVPEPERLGAVTESLVSFKQVLVHLWSLRSARWLALGCGLTSVAGYGLANWMPSFLIRSHGMGTAELGVWLALIAGVGGGLGTFLGGLLADRLGQRDARWPLWLPAGVLCTALPFLVLTFLLPSKLPALLIYIFPASVISCYLAPAIAVLHGLAPNRMRAMASAMLFLVINIIGLGVGPVAIGLFSDLLSASLGAESLRYSLLIIVCAGTAAGAVCFLVAARYLPSRPAAHGGAV